ncbi:MAG: SpoIIE family protein phosphatase [Verrucomicrobiales bacterium]|nr:SpoIIE family protein phosphatase [Verrucomicrobiales bacterium]
MSSRLPLRALVLEDSEFDARVMIQALRTAGYDVQWRRVETAAGMEEALRDQAWDVVLADYNMPEFNAPQALRILQQAALDVPFIIVSGGIGEDVAVSAMKAGAHDYVMKGNPARLLPAVERELREAVVRRKQREAEAQLRDSELRYRSLWETSPDAVLLCDAEGRIGFANPAAEVVFGLPAANLVGRLLDSLEPGPGGGLRAALAMAAEAPLGQTNRALVEGPALRDDGREILLEVASSRVELPDRAWFVLFARDITEKRRNETELQSRQEQMRAAREIQQRLFPRRAPEIPGFDVAGTSVPADATGGDYYDFLPMVDGHLGLVVADVSGHGLGPSLLMVETRALLRVVARNRVDPGEILTRANRVLSEDVDGTSYVTLLFVRLDPRTGELVHGNAGHPAGLVLDAEGAIKAQLRSTVGPLGFAMDSPPRPVQPVRMLPGDLLVLYTDGIREARRGGAADGEEFGLERMLEVFRQHREVSSENLVRTLCDTVMRFLEPSAPEDDMTVVIVRAVDKRD